jgi:hypothetical protein
MEDDLVATVERNRAVAYTERKAEELADFDQQFVFCMHAKGYKVPAGFLTKLYALVPYAEEQTSGPLEKDWVRDWLIKHMLTSFEETARLIPEVDAFGVATTIYDHGAFLHALTDCAARAWPGGPSEAVEQMLDAFPVPDVVPPPEVLAQVPVLPPPPQEWQPMVVPMEDPAPAEAKAGVSGATKTVLVIAISAIGIGGALALGKSLPTNGGGGSGGAWYMHYSCGGDTSCIANPPPPGNGGSTAPGGNTGIIGTNSSQSECENSLIPFENIGLAQSYWCDQSSDPAEAS